MTETGTTTALTGGVALLERALGYTLGSLQLVTPATMSNPTPCCGWDLRALLLHLDDSLLALHEAGALGRLGLGSDGHRGHPALDPVTALRTRASEILGTWANARGDGRISIADRALTPDIVAATGAVEVAVHGWDVTRACGHDRPVPPALAEELLDLCPVLVGAAGRSTRFAAPVDVSPLASSSDRLVAFLGRRPD